MRAYVLAADRTETAIEANPHCGADFCDFCDQCGDCLSCYGNDPCGMHEGDHNWIVYADKATAFYADHPEAVRAEP